MRALTQAFDLLAERVAASANRVELRALRVAFRTGQHSFKATSASQWRRNGTVDAQLGDARRRTLGGLPSATGIPRLTTDSPRPHLDRTLKLEVRDCVGAVVSPALLNIALHGMEQAAGVRYGADGFVRAGSPVLIRYADDYVVLCHTRQQALAVKAKLAAWLAPRGLAFNEDKTRVVTLEDGFDFLGFNVRGYRGKLLIKPSKAAVLRIRERLRTELWSLRGSNAPAVIKRLNPIIRGWAAYYRTQVPAETFGKLDNYLWGLSYKWARFSHANKPMSWVVARYFGQFNKPGKTGGCSATATAAPTCTALPRPASSDTNSSSTRRHPTTRRLPTTGRPTESAPTDQQHRPVAPPGPGRTLCDL